MLLDEPPHILIGATIGNFNIQPDKLAIARINESISKLQEDREGRLQVAEKALKKLSRTYTALNNNHLETLSSHSSTAHASEITTLDNQKFRIAKSANDLEIESERLSSQLADLQARLQELETQGVDGGDNARRGLVDDENTLKLKIYRGMGIDIEKDKESGEYNKAIIRNEKRGDVNIVNLDNKFSRYFYANYLWQQL